MTEAQDAGHKAHVVEPRKASPRRRQLGSDTKDQKESSRRIQRKVVQAENSLEQKGVRTRHNQGFIGSRVLIGAWLRGDG